MLASSALQHEPAYKASKWLKTQILLEEMGALFDALEPFYIVNVAQVSSQSIIERSDFERVYRDYILTLQRGEPIAPNPFFSCVLTRDLDAVWSLPCGPDKQMAKVRSPVIQIQNHRLSFGAENTILSMAYGLNTISWGLQFSFPQIWQTSKGVVYVLKEPLLNVALYRSFTAWVREYTRPTPFLFNEQKVNSPIRLDRRSFSWINTYAALGEVKIAH